jgi:hypothetical protein
MLVYKIRQYDVNHHYKIINIMNIKVNPFIPFNIFDIGIEVFVPKYTKYAGS